MVGQTLQHYEILEKLGEGGMGVVYKARDTTLDREVALKFLPESLTPTEEDLQRFIREAQSAAALNHPNICTIYSVDEHEGRQFITMEFIEGETLRSKIDAGSLTFSKALDYARQIASALAEAHEAEITHRDIKPENIMLNSKGRIKVTDFGLAKLKHGRTITKTGDTVGTLPYSSPEQIRGEDLGPRSDLFSLGIVFFEMLTGARPFRGEHRAAMTYAIVNEEPASIRDELPEAPQKLLDFFDRILAKDPDERIESAAAARNLIEDIKESSDRNLHDAQETVAAATSTNQETNNGSKTISIKLPTFVFGNKSIGRTGLFVGVIAVLALILVAGWWVVGNKSIEDNDESLATDGKTNITDRSIAVLPFNNLSGTDEVTSITRGIHDDLLTRLSNIGDLRVTSRTSVAHYRNTDLALSVIADSLGVRWIMVGGVQQGGDQIQVNAQLIDPLTDANVWADSYRRELTAENLFSIQEDITSEIAEALQTRLTKGEQNRVRDAPTENLEAYRLYIQGRRELAQRRFIQDQHSVRAIKLFWEAIEQDSSFALAWAGLADARTGELPDSIGLPNVNQKEAARRALELDPDLAEAHAAMGYVHLLEMDGPAAVRQLRSALELKPSYWEAHHLLGVFHLLTGQVNDALDHLELAVELNPQHARARHGLYDAYLASGQAKKSLDEARKQQRLELEETSAIGGEVRALFGLGQLDEARRLAEEQILDPGVSKDWKGWFRAYLVSINSKAGDTDQSQKHLAQLLEEVEDPAKLGQAYAALGKTDLALEAYQRMSEKGWGRLGPSVEFRYGIMYDLEPLNNDPRYEELIHKANSAWGLNSDGSIPKDN